MRASLWPSQPVNEQKGGQYRGRERDSEERCLKS